MVPKTKTPVQSILNDEITYTAPEFVDDVNKLQEGQQRTFILMEVKKEEKLVMNFSGEVPRELAWKPYAKLHPEDRKLIDEIEPEVMKSGTPKTKFSHRYLFLFKEMETGVWKNFQYDVSFLIGEDGQPWADFRAFLTGLGADFSQSAKFKIGDYIAIGDKFTGTLISKTGTDGKNHVHLDKNTLEPVYDSVE